MGKQRYRLERVQHIAHSRDTVFAFFADAGNLELLTPDFLHFRILTPRPIVMQPGTLIDYQLRLFSVPIRWRTRIDVYEPPTRFTDVQLLGPYRYWHHVHAFFDVPGGTLVVDRVDYELPFGCLGILAHGLVVRRTLEQIFDYRRACLEHHFVRTPSLINGDGRDTHHYG
jgi:ligand-binding SRPBCC domain-containing protein